MASHAFQDYVTTISSLTESTLLSVVPWPLSGSCCGHLPWYLNTITLPQCFATREGWWNDSIMIASHNSLLSMNMRSPTPSP
jgi:hypothetical protein